MWIMLCRIGPESINKLENSLALHSKFRRVELLACVQNDSGKEESVSIYHDIRDWCSLENN
jgi:hypothetical protein